MVASEEVQRRRKRKINDGVMVVSLAIAAMIIAFMIVYLYIENIKDWGWIPGGLIFPAIFLVIWLLKRAYRWLIKR